MRAALPLVAALIGSCGPAPAVSPAAPPGAATPKTQLRAFFATEWERTMQQWPTRASRLGDRRWDDRWPDVSPAGFERRAAYARDLEARVHAIDASSLGPEDRLDLEVFTRDVDARVEGEPFRLWHLLLDPRDGVLTADALADALPFAAKADYDAWIARMRAVPAYVDGTIATLREGVREHIVPPRAAVDGVPAQIARQVVADPEQSPFWAPLRRMPASFSAADRERLANDARDAIIRAVVPAYRRLGEFFAAEYLPACLPTVGAWQLPRGDEAYAYLVRLRTTTSLTPAEVHDAGLRAVARIRGELVSSMARAGFKGGLADFFRWLRTDGRHEGVPGPHPQAALASERQDLPEFRRHEDLTAFVDGWAAYAESLGEDRGLHDEPYARVGELAHRMWSAVRLVVDTGMHALHWDRQRAIDYFLENVPRTELDVAREVDRCGARPAQALADEIGDLEILRLRDEARAALGPRFDIDAFHDVVLRDGPLPLDVLARHVHAWVTEIQR